MELRLFKTLWGHSSDFQSAVNRAVRAGFEGIEGPAPRDTEQAREYLSLLTETGLGYIAEITTAGTYVPNRHATPDDHLESLKRKLDQSLVMCPEFITCLGGCDAWSEELSLEFFARAIDVADSHEIVISFETHRGRSFFNPWTTQRIVEQLPDIKLTCDFSHWCVVCERLIDTEIDRNLGTFTRFGFGILASLVGKTIEEGAATSCYLATSPDLGAVSGQYFEDCNAVTIVGNPHMQNDTLGERLWDVSADLVGDYMDELERPQPGDFERRGRRPGNGR